MEHTYRRQANIDLAVRLAGRPSPLPVSLPAVPYVAEPQQAAGQPRGGWRRIARGVARRLYRVLLPFARPLVFRARRYLTEEVQKEIASLRLDITAAHEQSYQRSLQSHTWAYEQQLKMTVNVIQELQSMKQASMLRQSNMPTQKLDQVIERFMPWDDLATRLDRLESQAHKSMHRFAVPCGDGATLVATEVGYVLCAADDAPMIASLVELGDIELGTRLFIQSVIKQGDVFVDVGAHIGMHTLAAASAMCGQGHVYAFEAYEPTAKLLERSVWTNGYAPLVSIYNHAVAREASSRRLYLGKVSGHHSLFPLDATYVGDKEPFSVDTVRLDDVIPQTSPVTLMKIDVEGAELDVLAGAKSLIDGSPDMGIIVEYGLSHLQRSGHSRDEWFGAFASLNMEFRVIDPESGALLQMGRDELDCIESANLLFVRQGSSRWFSKP